MYFFNMCRYSDDLLNELWEKANPVDGYDSTLVRKDPCGAWIQRDKYNDRDSDFGWEVDHVYPQALLKEKGADLDEIDNIANLRAFNWHNNVSKGLDYPVYHIAVKSEDDKNVVADDEFKVNKNRQEEIKRIYGKYL
ncbi:hypothetical protein ONT17_04000 [Prevotella copri]|jgi:hypothetical protein|uniref:hypothetical protein n=2 Tax=Segatella copri TaxID=165179 RepID=UPI001C46117D|nr:hypothetical protein [Segatella copri]MBW0032488.1 hypothetical protein [Segatella copri]MCW4117915.1 hypothetical protein [Segatella copri]